MMLKNIQKTFQQSLLKNDDGFVSTIKSSKNLSSKKSMQIYQNAYYVRIIAAMAQDFPLLHEKIGESAFASLITDYLESYPSKHFNLRYVGKNLSKFIVERDPAFKLFSDLAAQEWKVLGM